MVPKIHAKGRSFRVTAHYVLHDPDAETKERVAWTATRNLATHNPDAAWRVMAATSMDQDRLKQQAGIPNTGRKSKDHVLHFTLSWHPEESDKLDRAEMLRATKTMLHVMEAQEHQCLIVAHNDEPQPHVHVVVNRVHPRDGRILSSSFERLKASRWAQKYEEERGKIYCAERVINNAARDRGEFTRGEGDLPRQVHEATQAVNDNDRREALIAQHRAEAAQLKASERRLADRQKTAWQKLEAGHRERTSRIDAAAKTVFMRRLSKLRDDYRPQWAELYHEHEAQQRQFEQREERLLGRVRNMFGAIDFRSLVGRGSEQPDGKAATLSQAFQVLADAGARRETLKSEQQLAQQALLREQRHDEAALRDKVQLARQRAQTGNRQRFATERNDLVLRKAMDNARLRAQWHEKSRRLREQLRELRQLEPEHERPAEKPRKSPTPPPTTRTSEILPKRGVEQAARQIDSWRDLQRSRLDRTLDRERDDDRDR